MFEKPHYRAPVDVIRLAGAFKDLQEDDYRHEIFFIDSSSFICTEAFFVVLFSSLAKSLS